MYAEIILAGRIVRKSAIKRIEDRTIATMTIAVNAHGSEEVDFFGLVAYGKNAEVAEKHIDKGKPLIVEGQPTINKWEKDGVKHRRFEVQVGRISFLSDKPGQSDFPSESDDIPSNTYPGQAHHRQEKAGLPSHKEKNMEEAAQTDTATASRYDGLRKQIPVIAPPNKLVCTRGIAEKFGHCMGRIMDRVKQYDTFTPDNDPWKEHDFGAVEFEQEKVFWKIDDYGGTDGLELVLTVMLAEEW